MLENTRNSVTKLTCFVSKCLNIKLYKWYRMYKFPC